MIPHPTRAREKGDGPSTGPFAALWLLLKQLLAGFGKHGFDFAAAFDAFEDRLRDTLLREVIARYNLDRADAPLNPDDFEILLVKRGRRAEYEIFSKSGRTLVDELNAQARKAWRDWFAARRRIAQARRWTQIRCIARVTLQVMMRRIGRKSRRITARRLASARGCGAAALNRATASRAPP